MLRLAIHCVRQHHCFSLSAAGGLKPRVHGFPRLSWVRYSSSTGIAEVVPVFHKALQYSNRVALKDQHGQYTYSELYSRSAYLSQLIQKHIGSKDVVQKRIAVLLPSDASYVISQWATWMAGHIIVPLCTSHPSGQLEYFIEDSQASICITTHSLADKLTPALHGQEVIVLEDSLFKPKVVEALKTESKEKTSAEDETVEDSKIEGAKDLEFYQDSNAMIIYTSGTTGPPKGVVLSHSNLFNQVSCLQKAWGINLSDNLLHVLPLHHIHGIVNCLLCPMYSGAKVVMHSSFNATNVWSSLLSLGTSIEDRINIFMAVPTIYVKLIEEYNNKLIQKETMEEYVKSVCQNNIRLMVCGSAALPLPVLEKWKEITGHTLLERYGMTEIGMALSNPLKGNRTPGYVGSPLPGVEVCIAQFAPDNVQFEVVCKGDNSGTAIEPEGEGKSGELLVKGPNIFKEYWNKPEATQKEFSSNGWFRTGDTAQFDEGIGYKILGRTSVDIIKSGGFKISALDIERHLLAHPNIVDVVVVGVPDITWGQKVAAVVHWNGDEPLDQFELREWCKNSMAHYQIPSVVLPLEESLPRNTMGKVNKKQILKEYFPETIAYP
ncbi:unnamed protein product, partial [Meganyctiphanes norvegica]